MNIHYFVHLDFARERELDSIARAERYNLEQAALFRCPMLDASGKSVSKDRPTAAPEAISRVTFRELAHRGDGGIDVTLLWSALENRLAVTVFDERVGELLVLDVEGDEALDVFYHPYASTASQAAA